MKKLFLLLAIAAIVVSCKTDEPKVFTVDPLATVDIKPKSGAWQQTAMRVQESAEYLSALDIVKKTTVIQYKYGGNTWERGFATLQRDTTSIIPSLKMWGTDIINEAGEYIPEFIESSDILLIHWEGWDTGGQITRKDTIGYIPEDTIRQAETKIKAAFEKNDSEEVYRLFKEAFHFLPTTGEEWRNK